MIRIIKKNEKYFFIIISFVLILFTILNNPVKQNDESTLFGETLKMYNGYYIYKDINVLVTPLFFYLGYIVFKIFGANYLIYRIYGAIIYTFLFFNIYKLLKELNMKTIRIFITELIIFIFLQSVIKVRS